MEKIAREFLASARSIGRNPGFSLLVIATLAVTLGCCTAVLTLVEAVLLKPLPYPDSSQLVLLFRGSTSQVGRGNDMAPGNCRALEQSGVFASMACWMRSELTVTGNGEAENIACARIEPRLFDVLGVKLARGRKFDSQESQQGRDRVAIITHEFWQRRFGAETSILSRQIILDGASHSIVGVLPPAFPLYQQRAEAFTPLSLEPESWANQGRSYLQGVARLHKQGTLDRARLDVTATAERLSSQFPVDNRALRLDVIPMQEDLTRQVIGPIQLLLVTTVLLLGIGFANITNLFLTRIQQRSGEFSIRRGLGASTPQLVLQITIEPLLLCLLGGGLGLLLANWSFSVLKLLVPPAMSPNIDIRLNWVSMAATLLLAFTATVVIALPSALRATRIAELRAGTQRSIGMARTKGFQFGLLATEVACALLLLVAANLLMKSWREVVKTPLGMNAENLLIAKIPPPKEQRIAFYDRVLAAIEQKPGVRSAAYASTVPLLWRGGNLRFRLQGENCEPTTCTTLYREVTSKYFATLQVPLRQGRYLDNRDHESAEPVVAVNDTFARRFFPNADAVGQRVQLEGGNWLRIVGVVADTREMGLEVPARQTLYVPYRQSQLSFAPPAMVMVRAETPSAEILRGVTTQAVSEVQTMQSLIDSLNEVRVLQSGATTFFAATALVLAGLGLYGILAYTLFQRRREMGIRIALGASQPNIMFAFNRSPLPAIGLGLLCGMVLAAIMTRWIEPLLVGVKPGDPFVFLGSASLLLAVGLAACWHPTRKALKIPPAEALRQI